MLPRHSLAKGSCLKEKGIWVLPRLCESVSHSFVSNSLQPHGLYSTRLLCPWASPGKNTGVGCHALLQRNLPNSAIEPRSLMSPALADGFFTICSTSPGKATGSPVKGQGPPQAWSARETPEHPQGKPVMAGAGEGQWGRTLLSWQSRPRSSH